MVKNQVSRSNIKNVNTLEVTVLTQSSSDLAKMFVSMRSRFDSNMGHVGQKLGH